MTAPTPEFLPDAEALATAVAGRLLPTLARAQNARGTASVVLPGGRAAKAVFEAVRTSPDLDTVDWSRVYVWWGDERFVAANDPDRNDAEAVVELLSAVPIDPTRVCRMPAADGPVGTDPEAAAAWYAEALAIAGEAAGTGDLPPFDVVLLGIGEDGHVASLFPGNAALRAPGTVAAVLDSPKPPPIRLTLTLAALNSADQVWVMCSGEEKAAAVAQAHADLASPSSSTSVPAALVAGRQNTTWWIDAAAASALPR